ncbi:MAG: hypothetical protein ACP5UM_06580 [Anaerolineae bacterium]
MDKRWRQAWCTFLTIVLALSLAGCADLPATVKPDVHVTIALNHDGTCYLMSEVAVHPLVDPLVQQWIEDLREEADQIEKVRNPEVKVTEREGRQYNALLLHFNSPQDLNAFVGTPYLLNAFLREIGVEVEIPTLFSEFELRVNRDAKQKPVQFSFSSTIPEATVQELQGIHLTFHVQLPERIRTHNADSVDDRTATWKVPPSGPFSMRAETRASVLESVRESVENTVAQRPIAFGAIGGVLFLAIVGLAMFAWYRRQQRGPENEDYWTDWSGGSPPSW